MGLLRWMYISNVGSTRRSAHAATPGLFHHSDASRYHRLQRRRRALSFELPGRFAIDLGTGGRPIANEGALSSSTSLCDTRWPSLGGGNNKSMGAQEAPKRRVLANSKVRTTPTFWTLWTARPATPSYLQPQLSTVVSNNQLSEPLLKDLSGKIQPQMSTVVSNNQLSEPLLKDLSGKMPQKIGVTKISTSPSIEKSSFSCIQ
jgi:hypothetical protein